MAAWLGYYTVHKMYKIQTIYLSSLMSLRKMDSLLTIHHILRGGGRESDAESKSG